MSDPSPSPPPKPRSPLRAAVAAFGFTVLAGTLISLVIIGREGVLHQDSYGRGQKIGQGLGVLGLVGAAVAYVLQNKKNDRDSATTRLDRDP